MRTTIILPFVCVVLACTNRPISLDDEAAGSSESESSSASESDAASTSTSETSDPDTQESDTTASFVPLPDDRGPGDCDILMQDCPEGEKCVGYSSGDRWWDAYKCVPVMGDQAPGEPCTWGGFDDATDDCDANSACWDVMEVDGGWVGTCLEFCSGTPDSPTCPQGSQCLLAGDWSPFLCTPNCDPVVQDCEAGLGCYWSNTGFFCVFAADQIPTGEPCGYVNDCAPGHLCAEAAALPNCAGPACCTQYCDLQLGDAGCVDQPGTVCVSFYPEGEAPLGEEHIGICILPP